ncbi:aquaporin Z [Acetobacter fallax]|uniref:Aquaporin Z n=1 Tax=Acetobacter fallax TaxID=1737473 RepID=A0ABX0KFQ7_9PROT|nr:aquaporin Z [Acetobacter fallax]NHO33971.1 aquaporin Z [Acetobacter fallax]NHO37506.1 aquaporin Z [Acetobacter fallax]
MKKKLAAEFFGTFWLVLGGCGSAVLAAAFPLHGIGFAGVALAFGLTVLTMAFAVGGISGGHFNPAVTLGCAAAGRFPWSDVLPYWGAQVAGGFSGAVVLYIIASGTPGFAPGQFAANGYGDLSPGHYGLLSALVCETVMTAFFIMVILGATSVSAPAGFAPIAIGLCLTIIHLVSIPVTNTSVNPARSTAVAFFAEAGAAGQLWLFWVAPLLGAAIGAVLWNALLEPGVNRRTEPLIPAVAL